MNNSKYDGKGKLKGVNGLKDSVSAYIKKLPARMKPYLKVQLVTTIVVFATMFYACMILKHVDNNVDAANQILLVIYYSPAALLIFSFVVGYLLKSFIDYKGE